MIVSQKKEFIFTNKPTKNCHASTVLPLGNGTVLAAWFAGTEEGKDDVDILTCIRSTDGWGTPARISADPCVPHWNPVLFQKENGEIILFFKVGKEISAWQTYFCLSNDGINWSAPQELVPGDTSDGRGPVKNKPIRLSDGRVIAPASDERNKRWCSFVDISDDDCKTWRRIKNIRTPSFFKFYVPMIQPTLWESEEGHIHMLTRTRVGKIYRSDSFDRGETWGKAYPTKMPNNNNGLDLVKVDDGRLFLVCNPVSGDWAERTPLELFVSADNGKTFNKVLCLEDIKGEFSYPAITVKDNILHITYTYNREYIVYWQIEIK